MSQDIYSMLVCKKGAAYPAEKIKPYSYLKRLPEIQKPTDQLAGNSRIIGDATKETQSRIIDMAIEICARHNLTYRETAYVLGIIKIESGFNPDAASNESAGGLAQYTDDTAREALKTIYSKTILGFALDTVSPRDRFDAEKGIYATILSFLVCQKLAKALSPNDHEPFIYFYHHAGWYSKANIEKSHKTGYVALANSKIMPLLSELENLLKQRKSTNFSLISSDGKPKAGVPYTITTASNPATNAPALAQTSPSSTVIKGVTDENGKTASVNVTIGSELILGILNKSALLKTKSQDEVAKKETYRIKTGDTLGAIARKNGISVEQLASDNQITNKNKIFTGQEIIISKPIQAPKSPPVAIQTETLKSLSIFQSEDVFFEYFRSHIALPENSALQRENQIEIRENPAITTAKNARQLTENHSTQENGKTKETSLLREKIKVEVEKRSGISKPELISEYTMTLLEKIGQTIGLSGILINSGIRPPERQAITMYQNIKSYGIQSQRSLYGSAGKSVINVFEESTKQGHSQSTTIELMKKKIESLSEQGFRVSKHCVSEKEYARLNVIDVSHTKMSSSMRPKFEEEIRKLKSIGKISCFITPGEKSGEPAYHIEIPQP